MSKNIAYQTDAISAYFGANRRRWDQFYASERTVIESVARRRDGVLGRVMDVGCACGGLGAALALRYELSSYTGIDINSQAIAFAQSAGDIDVPHTFICGDITQDETLAGTEFDTVFNLSCADWNVDFDGILSSSWSHVAPRGLCGAERVGCVGGPVAAQPGPDHGVWLLGPAIRVRTNAL